MTDEPPRPGLLPSRRSLLRAGAAAAALRSGSGWAAYGPGGPAGAVRSRLDLPPHRRGGDCGPAETDQARLERHRDLHRRRAARQGARPLRRSRPRRGIRQFRRLDRGAAGGHRHRQGDAGIGMALRWLKPLEQGFDVKITAGLHGGCLRCWRPNRLASPTSLRSRAEQSRSATTPARPRISLRSCWPRPASTRRPASNGGPIRPTSSTSRSRRARRRRWPIPIRARGSG